MSKNHFHSNQKLTDNIIAYLAGKLSSAEMYRLEKAMLDDPFLADAVEGLALIDNPDKRKAILADIRKSIGQTNNKKSFWVTYQPYAAAAAVLLMLSTLFLMKDFLLSDQGNEKALSEVQKNEESVDAVETETFQQDDELLPPEETEEIQPETKQLNEKLSAENQITSLGSGQANNAQNDISRSFSSDIQQEAIELESEETLKALQTDVRVSSMAKMETTKDTASMLSPEIRNSTSDKGLAFSDDAFYTEELAEQTEIDTLMSTQENIAVYSLKARKKAARSKKLSDGLPTQNNVKRQISGIVTDQENNPLPGVNIIIEGTQTGTVSDIDGKFSLPVSADNRLLYINYIGFDNEEIILEEGDNELEITMDEDVASLSEVVVTGYGETKRQQRNNSGAVVTLDREELGLPTITTYASPKGGMKAFKTHLAENMIYPLQAKNSNIKGSVKLGFTVTKNGKVRNVKVLRSLGSGFDQEAIRLLKSGPDWHPKTVEDVPEASERTIRIKFKPD